MLYLNGEPFATGRSRYSDALQQSQSSNPKIFVKVRPTQFDAPLMAQLDTGAAWSILESEVADDLGLLQESELPVERYEQRRPHGSDQLVPRAE